MLCLAQAPKPNASLASHDPQQTFPNPNVSKACPAGRRRSGCAIMPTRFRSPRAISISNANSISRSATGCSARSGSRPPPPQLRRMGWARSTTPVAARTATSRTGEAIRRTAPTIPPFPCSCACPFRGHPRPTFRAYRITSRRHPTRSMAGSFRISERPAKQQNTGWMLHTKMSISS